MLRKEFRNVLPEVSIALGMLAVMIAFSVTLGLPIVFPSGGHAAFVGIHYIYPLIGIALLGAFTFAFGDRGTAGRFLVALPCYAAVLFAHFNIKLWIPHINPAVFDAQYWNVDEALRPLVDACRFIRTSVFFFIPYETNFYMVSFIFMFYASFFLHAVRTPEIFGQLIISVLLLQALGTFGYLAAPAIGPFIFEAGVDPLITIGQKGMLDFYNGSVTQGAGFLAENGNANFTTGLAAMPSLHVASAYLFFLFAWRHEKALVPLYGFILAFILVTAVASRWHYLIDIPVGMLLAWISFRLAGRLRPVTEPGKG